MDSHDLGRNRSGGIDETLQQISSKVLVLGIDSDLLYPLSEQKYLVKHIPDSDFKVITSINGHDGFLIEQDQVAQYISEFLMSLKSHPNGSCEMKISNEPYKSFG
jgi:homoserine O-acetyltransferase